MDKVRRIRKEEGGRRQLKAHTKKIQRVGGEY